jgi:3-keto-disaccharide hydrolase
MKKHKIALRFLIIFIWIFGQMCNSGKVPSESAKDENISNPDNTLTNEQISNSQHYVPLFNGKNFNGWKFHLGEEGADNYGTFTIEDETIYCTGKPAGYIYTEKSYSNYRLSYEWAFERPENLQADSLFKGNSGCLLHIGTENMLNVWPLSIEVQGMNKQAGMIIPIPRSVKCERSYDKESRDKAINPVGEWNKTEIDVNNGQILVKLNGVIVSTAKDSELTKGPIGLQSEGAPIRWRNIQISER